MTAPQKSGVEDARLPVADAVRFLLGTCEKGLLVGFLFSTRLDEVGTDGRSRYTIVGGAVALVSDWDALERRWGDLMRRNKVGIYHHVDFVGRRGDFADWDDFKRKRFTAVQEKIIKEQTIFRVAVGIDNDAHAAIKREMHGVKGFRANSNYGLAFRLAMVLVCDHIKGFYSDSKVAFMLEDGAAGASDAAQTYQEVKSTEGHRWRPSRYAHMLAGFALVPKGERRSLEAADQIAGVALPDFEDGAWNKRPQRLSALMDENLLRQWHGGMLDEKALRQAHWHRNAKKA